MLTLFCSLRCWRCVAVLLCAVAGWSAQVAQAQTETLKLRVVGGLASVGQFTRLEEPFWSKDLARLSQGRFSAEIVAFDRAAVPGMQMLQLLRLGVVPLAGFDPMRLVQFFAEQHPGLRFQLFALSSEEILERLGRNQLDLGLSYLDRLNPEHFDSLELAQTSMGLLYDRRHFQFSGPALRWESLIELPLGLLSAGMHFRQSIDHSFRSRSLTPSPRLETDAVHQLLQAVSAGLCCAIMPLNGGLAEFTEHLALTPIEEAQIRAPLGLILRRSAPRSALAEACFAEAHKLFPGTTGCKAHA